MLAAVPTLSTKLFISSSKFASSSAIPTSKFSHAALVAFNEPSIVVLASFAVVPVMPRFSCTAWIAVITSENLDGSSALPVSVSASDTRRSSSDFVPP